MKDNVKKLTTSAVCLALCLVLPFLTGQVPQIGNMLCPMHIPVLLCGFICGWQYGAAVGFIAPLLRFAIFGMPPVIPIGLAMAFELAAYGVSSGLLYKLLPRRSGYIYLTLVISMLLGRGIWGIARYAIARANGSPFTMPMFLSGAFTTAVPGIICQLVLIPLLVMALKRAKISFNE